MHSNALLGKCQEFHEDFSLVIEIIARDSNYLLRSSGPFLTLIFSRTEITIEAGDNIYPGLETVANCDSVKSVILI